MGIMLLMGNTRKELEDGAREGGKPAVGKGLNELCPWEVLGRD